MAKRDRLKVIYDILRVIQKHNNSIKPTPLLRYSNLSSQSFIEYVEELESKDMIRKIKVKGREHITLTDKGFNYLEKYSSILGFIEEFEL
ncbi:hypothetical protein JW968_03440 [Candidatus Woesearchaeota archaeon]|nr:hypothetical protein [Candidatus Woesearchaeota archaeon]